MTRSLPKCSVSKGFEKELDSVHSHTLVSTKQMSAANKAGDTANSIKRELVVANKLGIHARPAAMFVKTANQFECDVFVEKDGETVNGKSIMGLMMLAAGPGSKIRVQAEGEDAARAVNEIEALLKRKFDED